MSIDELMASLGYNRSSTITWCEKNEIPIKKHGKRAWVHRWLVEIFFEQDVIELARSKGLDADAIVEALVNGDKLSFVEAWTQPSYESSNNYRRARRGSKKSISEILNNFK